MRYSIEPRYEMSLVDPENILYDTFAQDPKNPEICLSLTFMHHLM